MPDFFQFVGLAFEHSKTVFSDPQVRKNTLIYIAGSTLFSLIVYLIAATISSKEKEVGLFSILALGFVFLLAIASVLFSVYYSVRILGYSLQRLGFKTREFGWGI